MKKLILFAFSLLSITAISQVKGLVVDQNNTPLSGVTILIEDTYNSTSSNENGFYELNLKKTGKYTIVFQYIGYKTHKETVNISSFPYELNAKLQETNYTLNEVIINNQEDPAKQIIKNAIAAKKVNSEKTAKYKADFYSKGIVRIKDAPKKIMGQDLGDFEGALDSTRTGILYLSETVSKLTFQKPDKMKETIIASKVSGKDNGFSFNNAATINYDFYENYIDRINMISPINDNAFNYYKFKIEGTFYNDDKQQINKIKVIPRRDSEPVFEGYIYIVEDSWAIYAIDLILKGYRMQIPAIDKLTLKQNFSYNKKDNLWIKNTQSLDFNGGIMGINLSGKFNYVYSNFEFVDQFEKKTFTNEVLNFENDANKKDGSFWDLIRPIPLTQEESTDYVKKDSIQTLRKSQVYLDSIDKKGNKFKILKIITGYNYKNSYKKWSINYSGFLKSLFQFNTVQGYFLSTGISYTKRDPDTRTFSTLGTKFNYGLVEKKLRMKLEYSSRFNSFNFATVDFSGGSDIVQFNETDPISNIVNTVSSLYFKDNYMKLYHKNFITAGYRQEIVNGIFASTSIEYCERKSLFNNSSQSQTNSDKSYISNHPLLPLDYNTPIFPKHNLIKGQFSARFSFGQKYLSRPNGKFNIPNDKYPVLSLSYEKGFGGSQKNYNYDLISSRLTYKILMGNKGEFEMNLKSGQFFNAKNIAFADYKHFNGNQTHIGQTNTYLNVFNLLPYYDNSTNDAYFEAHLEHNDSGFFTNKIPLLSKLKSSLVLGYHNLSLPKKLPYHEVSIGLDNLGWGKFKLFRFDYVRSYQNGFKTDGVIFGLKILNLLD
jgi:hypothetical protein